MSIFPFISLFIQIFIYDPAYSLGKFSRFSPSPAEISAISKSFSEPSRPLTNFHSVIFSIPLCCYTNKTGATTKNSETLPIDYYVAAEKLHSPLLILFYRSVSSFQPLLLVLHFVSLGFSNILHYFATSHCSLFRLITIPAIYLLSRLLQRIMTLVFLAFIPRILHTLIL